jgi:SET domain-containing protein
MSRVPRAPFLLPTFSFLLLNSQNMPKKSKSQKRAVRIEVRESGVHGRGVYAAEFIPQGTRIIEYTGQRVSWEAAPNDENDPHTFNFGLENGEVINPEIGGNDARWINHSCDPNCEAIEEDDRIFIFAIRDIETGEELFYDYALEIDEPITEESKKKFACQCGAPNCRGTMLDTSS